MNPIVYPADELSFNSNGLCIVTDALSCVVKHEASIKSLGVYELTMKVPVKSRAFQFMERWNIILASVEDAENVQPFDIYDVSMDGGICNVSAKHISYRLKGTPIAHFNEQNVPITDLPTIASTLQRRVPSFWQSPFTFSVKNPKTGSFYWWNDTKPAWEVLKDIIKDEHFGCDVLFDGTDVILGQIGEDNHIAVRYGVNIKDFDSELTSDDSYNSVWAYYRKEEYMAVPNSAVKLSATDRPYMYAKFENKTSDYDTYPSYDEMTNKSRALLSEISDDGELSITVDVSRETENFKARLYDTVRLFYDPLNIVDKDIRIIAIEYDSLSDHTTRMTLGNRTKDLSDVLMEW